MKNRKSFFRKGKKTFTIIGDGHCEKWYFQLLREQDQITINIEPKLIIKASLKKQYEYVKELADTYDKVFWVVDYDVIERESRECKKRDEKRSEEFKRYYTDLSSLTNVEILVVNPCFEYWLLLHFKYSNRTYKHCDEAGKDLKIEFPDYEKTEKFYKNKKNNIYALLRGRLPCAIQNASYLGSFSFNNPNAPICEINKLFNKDGTFKVN